MIRTSGTAIALCLAAAAAAQAPSPASAPAPARTQVTAGGSLAVPAFDLPPSSLASPELKAAYVEHLRALSGWPRPPGAGATPADWKAFRAKWDDVVLKPVVTALRARYPVDEKATTIGTVPVIVVTPRAGISERNRRRVLIELHGGGFVLGGGGMGGLAESIAVAGEGRTKVVAVDYRMAPEFAHPAASEDVATVYRALLKEHRPDDIGIIGCSAGGRLAAMSVAWFAKEKLPQPGAIVMACAAAGDSGGDSAPWGTSGIYQPGPGRSGDPYLGKADKADPLVRPIGSADVLSRFPPTLLITGTRAAEASAVAVTHTALLRNGVDSQLYLIEGAWHGFYGVSDVDVPESRDARAYMFRWLDAHLGTPRRR